MGRQAVVMIAVAAGVVVALFALTVWSGSREVAEPRAEAPLPAPVVSELSPDVRSAVETLEAEIAEETDDAMRLAKRKELVERLAQAGAFVRAAEAQEAVAEAAPSADAWAEAGGLYLTEVLRDPGQNQAPTAARAAAAYERALALDSTNLDVKTDLATAYQYDAQNPMRPVQTLREVLNADPDHVQANFNFALMLAVIGRTDQATERLERVLALTEHTDPIHVRADAELARLRGAGAPPAGPES